MKLSEFFLGISNFPNHIPRFEFMDVKLPNLGEGADSGTVVSVLVREGATIRKGQNIIELETGKAVAPIPASSGGVVKSIRVKEGDKLSVGQMILVVDDGGAAPAPVPAASTPAVPRPAAKSVVPAMVEEVVEEISGEELETVNESVAAAPSIRKLARELGLDLRKIRGSESGGRIVLGDIKAWLARVQQRAAQPKSAPGAAAKPAPVNVDFSQWGSIYKRPFTSLRKVIAQRMVESRTLVPEVTQFDEADLTGLAELRKKFAPAYEAKGARLTVTSFVLKAVVSALKKHPVFGSSLDEVLGEIVFKEYFHLGLAVDTEAGLLVPVIRDVDKKDLLQLSKDVAEVAAKARDRKLDLKDMQGGTFTISNQGGIGGAHFTPVINRPEVAILGLGKSVLKPVVRDGQIVPRMMMPVCVAYDHRVIDGGVAARFTVDLVAALEGFTEADVKL